jgi:uncharacterized metal-binding protein
VRTRSSTAHPVITGLLILVALGMIIQLLPYLLAAAAITQGPVVVDCQGCGQEF